MKKTLLEMTQDILSSLNSDEVNSIGDTTESLQVSTIIKTTYDDLVSRGEFPIQMTLFNLTASGDPDKPTLMTKPEDINDIRWIKYDCQVDGATTSAWTNIQYLCLDDFLSRMYRLNEANTNVGSFAHTIGTHTATFFYTDDHFPKFWTSYDDNTLIFDSYDATLDTTLQNSKSQGYGEKSATFSATDDWVPNLHPHQFALLYNEAKALAWAELKEAQHMRAEDSARKNWVHLQRTKNTTPFGVYDTGPNYGRK